MTRKSSNKKASLEDATNAIKEILKKRAFKKEDVIEIIGEYEVGPHDIQKILKSLGVEWKLC